VLFDVQSGKLLYIKASKDDGVKLSVEFDYRVGKSMKLNMIVSGFRQANDTINERIRGNLYQVVR